MASQPQIHANRTRVSQDDFRTGPYVSRQCVGPRDFQAHEALRARLRELFTPRFPAVDPLAAERDRTSWRTMPLTRVRS